MITAFYLLIFVVGIFLIPQVWTWICNFLHGWENAKRIKYEQGFTFPAPRDFVGFSPLTEPESLAIYNFTLLHNFRLVIAYHTQGQEIYWQFQNLRPTQSLYIGTRFAQSSGYTLANTPYNSSFAGYKDWFIQDYNRPRIYYRSWHWRKSSPYFTVWWNLPW